MIDSLGRDYQSSSFGALWTQAEIDLLNQLCERQYSSRPQIAARYIHEALALGYPARSVSSIVGKLQRHYPDSKMRFFWSEEEDNQLSELLQEYPFAIAHAKYQQWATEAGFPHREKTAIYCRASNLGISTIDPVVVACTSTIARSLSLSDSAIAKYLRRSRIKTETVGQRVACDVDKFYRWFVSSKSWIACMEGCAQTGRGHIDLDNWSLLLGIPIDRVRAEWNHAQEKIIKVRAPLTFQWMRVNDFAKQNGISANAIRVAIRKNRSEVSGVKFEVCSQVKKISEDRFSGRSISTIGSSDTRCTGYR